MQIDSIIRLKQISDLLSESITNSEKKNNSWLFGAHRDIAFSQDHIAIRKKFLTTVKEIDKLVFNNPGNEAIQQQALNALSDAYDQAITKSRELHQKLTQQTATAITLVRKLDNGKLIDVCWGKFGNGKLGVTVATRQHFMLEQTLPQPISSYTTIKSIQADAVQAPDSVLNQVGEWLGQFKRNTLGL